MRWSQWVLSLKTTPCGRRIGIHADFQPCASDRTYKVQILDPDLCKTLLDISGQVSDEELGMRALNNNARRANSVLTLPLDKVRATFLTVPAEKRFNKIEVDHHIWMKACW